MCAEYAPQRPKLVNRRRDGRSTMSCRSGSARLSLESAGSVDRPRGKGMLVDFLLSGYGFIRFRMRLYRRGGRRSRLRLRMGLRPRRIAIGVDTLRRVLLLVVPQEAALQEVVLHVGLLVREGKSGVIKKFSQIAR